jgi:outer membrane protein OmpA-like peptidoglycan-associated protein
MTKVETFSRFIIVLALIVMPLRASAQVSSDRLSVGIMGGASKYYGDFADDLFGLNGEIYIGYSPIEHLTISANASVSELQWKVTPYMLQNLPDYFGPNAGIGGIYPNTLTTIEDRNRTRATSYDLQLAFNILPSSSFMPYVGAGVGALTWSPTNSNEHSPLPNNLNRVYDRLAVNIPVFLGMHVFLTDDLSINAKGTYRFTFTPYLDDVDLGAYDNYGSISAGVAFHFLGDNDWDDDGLENSEERNRGTDPRSADTDGDGLNDFVEVKAYLSDPLKVDSDVDNLTDFEEATYFNSSPIKKDTDGDGLLDDEEAARKTNARALDTDEDGVADAEEVYTYYTNPTNPDTDGDGLIDADEVRKHGTSPLKDDTDGDGLTDGSEVVEYGSHPLLQDSDGDCLRDGEEALEYHTDPTKTDSDNDRLFDGEEVLRFKTDPLRPDTDFDGLTDADELSCRFQTNPLNPDTDGDGTIDSKDTKPSDKCCGDCGGIPPYASGPGRDCGCRDSGPQIPPAPAAQPPASQQQRKKFAKDIRFRQNTSDFDFNQPETKKNLEELLSYMQESCPDLRVMIEGHASGEGDASRNRKLSEERARRVREWLLEQGIESQKITGTMGMGAQQPRVPEPKGRAAARMSREEREAIRAQNRRIEVAVLKECEN